ncbi:DUF7691 family protein [Dactylosporangium sp. CA-139066]|uniref:DUF7691 family protein n=1 Tax=Dactylosporangium sp. CA-139066 TaxID=3239930 RepID=UPI003D8C063A
MGYGVMAYPVDIEALREVCGGGDDRRRRAICGRFRQQIARFNDDFELSNERGAGNLFAAIGHIVMGQDMPLPGYLYGYGFKYIVEFHGRFLDNSPFYPCPSAYLDAHVDPTIKATGATLSMFELISGGAPVPLPPPDDFPGIGHWPAADVAANVEPLGAGTTDEVRTVAAWARQAAAAGHGIVGFYH